ncbi:MAG: hypothetical protein F4Z07_04930 [Dehalococcoidia bacterium]|nr:hypothetical protein [Dehalococcoidia bacterium]
MDCGDPDCPDAVISFILVDDDGNRSLTSIDVETGREWARMIHERHKGCGVVFDELVRSVQVQ